MVNRLNLIFCSALLLSACTQFPTSNSPKSHAELIVLDSHMDIPLNFATQAADPAIDSPMQVDFPKMTTGGLDGGFFIVYVGQGPLTAKGYADAYTQANTKFDAIERMAALHPNQIGLARNPAQVHELITAGKKVAIIGVENAYPLGPNAEHLQEFAARGVGYLSLTHFGHNQFADSSGSNALAGSAVGCGGLCPLGRQLIESLNRLGIMVDVSHSAKTTTLQAVAVSTAPVIASHSALYAFQPIPRNITDEEMLAIAQRGGVVQLVAFDSYLKPVPKEKQNEMASIRERLGFTSADSFATASESLKLQLRQSINALDSQWPRANISDFVDQIDYAVALIGIEHVGIASDFGGGGGVTGWDDASQSKAITQELRRRGYSWPAIANIWGENLLRVWSNVKTVADTMSALD